MFLSKFSIFNKKIDVRSFVISKINGIDEQYIFNKMKLWLFYFEIDVGIDIDFGTSKKPENVIKKFRSRVNFLKNRSKVLICQ